MTRTQAIVDLLENLGVTIVDVDRHVIEFTADDADEMTNDVLGALPLLGGAFDYTLDGELESGRICVNDPDNPPRG